MSFKSPFRKYWVISVIWDIYKILNWISCILVVIWSELAQIELFISPIRLKIFDYLMAWMEMRTKYGPFYSDRHSQSCLNRIFFSGGYQLYKCIPLLNQADMACQKHFICSSIGINCAFLVYERHMYTAIRWKELITRRRRFSVITSHRRTDHIDIRIRNSRCAIYCINLNNQALNSVDLKRLESFQGTIIKK